MKASPRREFKPKCPGLLFQALGNSATGDKTKTKYNVTWEREVLSTCILHWDLNMTTGKSLTGYDSYLKNWKERQ